ncbi:MAG TPA: hypothetical protein V6C86_04140 [Oculatellaceae cyanobacterium]
MCKKCYLQTSITVGTLFERIRRVEPWLAAIWLMERGVALTSSAFHRLVDIAQSTALVMLRKIRLVLESNLGETAKLMASSHFKRLMCRRSLETPARLHPSAEDDFKNRKDDPKGTANGDASLDSFEHRGFSGGSKHDDYDNSTIDDLAAVVNLEEELMALPQQLRESAMDILNNLLNGPVSFDELSTRTKLPPGPLNSVLTILEICGLVQDTGGGRFALIQPQTGHAGAHSWNEHANGLNSQSSKKHSTQYFEHRSRHGDRYEPDVSPASDSKEGSHQAQLPPILTKDLALIKAVTLFISRTFSGVSRKYLQLYLVALWCCVDRTFWTADKIFKKCFLSPPLPYQNSLAFVSSPILKVEVERNAP